MSPYIRHVPTASGATAVQVIFSERRGAKNLKHVCSAHDEEQLALLQAKAQQIIDGQQQALDLGIDMTPAGSRSQESPLPVTSERAGYLIEAITGVYRALRFDEATEADQVFSDLVTLSLTSASYASFTSLVPLAASTLSTEPVFALSHEISE